MTKLRAAGCGSRNIYREKVTGARADRRELYRKLGKLAPGDVGHRSRERLNASDIALGGECPGVTPNAAGLVRC
jgi:hypothetical protein